MLCLYLAAIFIRPHEIGDPYGETSLIRTLVMFTFFSWLVFQKDKFYSTHLKLLLALGGVIALSSITNGWIGGAIPLLIAFMTAAILPTLLCSNLITTQKRQIFVMLICIVAAMFMVHNGHSQHIHPEGLGWTGTKSVEGNRITYMGFFNDPNDLGMFLVMTLPFAFYLRKHGNGLLKFMSLGVISAIVYGVIMTDSRGSLLGLLSLVGFYFFLKYGIKKTVISAVAVLPVIIIIMSKFRKIEQGESAQGRVDAWYQGFQMFFSNPLLGVGKGNFTEYNSHTAHNSFVLVLGELGIVGYTLWCMVLGLCFLSLYKAVKWYEKQDNSSLSDTIVKEIAINRALLFSFVGFVTTAFFLSRSYTMLFFVFCGMVIACNQRTNDLIPELAVVTTTPPIKKLIKSSLISIIALYVVVRVLL